MWAFLGSWFLGGGLDKITSAISDTYLKARQADNDGDKIRYEQYAKTLETRRDIMVAEAGNSKWGWINPTIRAAFSMPVAVYYGKIFLWDKALGLGSTDPLSPDLTWTARTIIGFYFLYEAITYLRK